MLDRHLGASFAVLAFEKVVATKAQQDQPPVVTASRNLTDRFTDLQRDRTAPIALLTVSRLDLQVPVFRELNQGSLSRGAAIVTGSPLPGESGNISVAAHRDSFFRPLKDIRIGDVVVLRSTQTSREYRVVEIFITDPLDLSVLESIEQQTLLTLITCYPFHYIGFAPDRFIVRAAALPVTALISSI